MDINQSIAEYYDELYPVTEDQKKFYEQELHLFPKPAKLLRIGCGTGSFEHNLAKNGIDVTGLETSQALLESANRKRRTQLMSMRFFQMSSLEMVRFLGKKFYNIISILDGRIIFTHDQTLMKKLFFDCKQLLADGGILILSLPNFEKFASVPLAKLPDRNSIRASLFTQVWTAEDGTKTLQQDLETGSGRILSLMRDMPIYPLASKEIEQFAHEAGFKHCDFYSGFNKGSFAADSDTLVARIS